MRKSGSVVFDVTCTTTKVFSFQTVNFSRPLSFWLCRRDRLTEPIDSAILANLGVVSETGID